MAYFEMMPAGLPAGLQSGMDSVLNKKFGTATSYAPGTWPDTVNLMGSLPEKTIVSSPIADFSDGADDVPTKSLVVTIPPTLSGVSEVSETQTGRNLFNVADYSQIYTDRDGVDSYNYRYMIIHLKPNTTYTVSQNSGEAKSAPIVLINSTLPVGGSNYLDLRTASGSKTYTTGDDGYLYIGSVNSYDDVVYTRLQECKVQIEYGSTAHAYEPYTTPTVYTASLGRTIYGGQVDIVNGTGKDTRIKKTVRWGDLGNVTQLADVTRKEIVLSASEEAKYITASASTDLLNDKNLPYDMTYSGNFEHIYIANSTRILVYLPNGTDADTEITVSYTLADALQTDFTFDGQEIDTMLGYNAFWSDEGDTEVTYRADINLALGGN